MQSISISIPVFNMEKYLEKFLNVISQALNHLQVILVNYKSTNASEKS